MLLIILFIICVMSLIATIFSLYKISTGPDKRDGKLIKLDEYTTNFFINQLNSIISYQTVYYIDSTFGKEFSNANSIITDIPNDEIIKAHGEIINVINNIISPDMHTYLAKVYGEKWLSSYINIETLSLVLNYSRQTIDTLTIEKFK